MSFDVCKNQEFLKIHQGFQFFQKQALHDFSNIWNFSTPVYMYNYKYTAFMNSLLVHGCKFVKKKRCNFLTKSQFISYTYIYM